MRIGAALRRVRYARIVGGDTATQSQKLLIPVSLKFERADADVFEASRPAFASCGFDVEDFGKNFYKISAAPAWLEFGEIENFVRDFVEECRAEDKAVRPRALGAEAFARLASKRLSSAGFVCDESSAKNLLSELVACDFHMTSPDGKPTLREISESEISRMFGI